MYIHLCICVRMKGRLIVFFCVIDSIIYIHTYIYTYIHTKRWKPVISHIRRLSRRRRRPSSSPSTPPGHRDQSPGRSSRQKPTPYVCTSIFICDSNYMYACMYVCMYVCMGTSFLSTRAVARSTLWDTAAKSPNEHIGSALRARIYARATGDSDAGSTYIHT